MGLAMSHLDIDKAIQSYHKAIALQEDQAPAYQGLIKLLTDLPSPTDSQVKTLQETLQALSENALPKDHVKQGETLQQLAESFSQSSQYPQVRYSTMIVLLMFLY